MQGGNPYFPPNYVTLKQLHEQRLKEKQEAEDRKLKEEEGENERQRLRKLEEEEERRRRNQHREEERLRKPRPSPPGSTKPYLPRPPPQARYPVSIGSAAGKPYRPQRRTAAPGSITRADDPAGGESDPTAGAAAEFSETLNLESEKPRRKTMWKGIKGKADGNEQGNQLEEVLDSKLEDHSAKIALQPSTGGGGREDPQLGNSMKNQEGPRKGWRKRKVKKGNVDGKEAGKKVEEVSDSKLESRLANFDPKPLPEKTGGTKRGGWQASRWNGKYKWAATAIAGRELDQAVEVCERFQDLTVDGGNVTHSEGNGVMMGRGRRREAGGNETRAEGNGVMTGRGRRRGAGRDRGRYHSGSVPVEGMAWVRKTVVS